MKVLLAAAILALSATPSLADFKLSFDWGNIPLCTTGNPNIVDSPAFKIEGVPAGTTSIQFTLKDLNARGYDHGGSKRLGLTADGIVPSGVFKYKSPCPPGGRHTYEWTAVARAGGKVLARATAQRVYPE